MGDRQTLSRLPVRARTLGVTKLHFERPGRTGSEVRDALGNPTWALSRACELAGWTLSHTPLAVVGLVASPDHFKSRSQGSAAGSGSVFSYDD